MNKLVTFYIVIISCSVLGQKAPIISELEGCFHGGYESFHENGKTKAKGNFYYNRRIGDWKIYDEEGALLVHRFYDSLGNVSVLVPATADDEVIRLLNKPLHVPARDSTGKYGYPKVREGNVIWSKRVWSYLPKQNNQSLYEFDWITLLNQYEVLDDLAIKRKVTVYKNDQFSEFYNDEETIEIENAILLGISIKKDYYYDLAIRKMDARVLAVTLFIQDTTNTIRKDLTLYLPTDLRPLLVKESMQHDDRAITNLDDLIYFNAYNEVIYKEESRNENTIQQFHPKEANNYLDFSKEIKIQIVEEEHRFWLGV